jgi:large subunit ribosomal protein L9
MRVILQEKVHNLGSIGDIVRVKDGYARNFLMPRGLAVAADEQNVKRLEHQRRLAAARASRLLTEARALAEKISSIGVTIKMEAGEDMRLFGSVTSRDVADALAAEGVVVDKKAVLIDEPIRTLGVKAVKIRLHPEVDSQVTVYVTKK